MKWSVDDVRARVEQYAGAYATHGVALVVFAALGVGLGFLRINNSTQTPDLVEKWAMPPLQRSEPNTYPAEDFAAAFWAEQPRATKKKADAQPVKKVIPWLFVGTVDQGKTMRAVIALDTGKLQRLQVGDALPDGATISSIASGQLTFERDGSARSIRLFAEKKAE